MHIGIMSDTHDNVWKLAEAVKKMGQVDVVVHCGDLCSPFVMDRLGNSFSGTPVHIVWGNNDGDRHMLTEVAATHDNIHLHGQTARLVLDGYMVAVNHYPDLARDMALSGSYDLVCYGHDHIAHHEKVGQTVLLNPGEITGINGRSSFARVDTDSGMVDFIDC